MTRTPHTTRLVRVCDRYIKMPVCMYPIMTTIHYPANCKQTLCTFLDGTEVSFESDSLEWVRMRIAEELGYHIDALIILDPDTGEVIDRFTVTPAAVTVLIQPMPLPPLNQVYNCYVGAGYLGHYSGDGVALEFSLKVAQDGTGDISVNCCRAFTVNRHGRNVYTDKEYMLTIRRLEETRRAEYMVTIGGYIPFGTLAFVFIPSVRLWVIPSAQNHLNIRIGYVGLDPAYILRKSHYTAVDDTRFVG
jgi:hypothetical protein